MLMSIDNESNKEEQTRAANKKIAWWWKFWKLWRVWQRASPLFWVFEKRIQAISRASANGCQTWKSCSKNDHWNTLYRILMTDNFYQLWNDLLVISIVDVVNSNLLELIFFFSFFELRYCFVLLMLRAYTVHIPYFYINISDLINTLIVYLIFNLCIFKSRIIICYNFFDVICLMWVSFFILVHGLDYYHLILIPIIFVVDISSNRYLQTSVRPMS